MEKYIELYIHYDHNHVRNININIRYAKMRKVVELVCCDYELFPIFSVSYIVFIMSL